MLPRLATEIEAILAGSSSARMWYSLLADFVVVIHVLYVGFILVGQMAILVGAWRRWSWVRNRWFRYAHLTAISIVALEAMTGIVCPLTVWEDDLRRLAGETPSGETFIGRAVHAILFFELPAWVFTAVYVLFAVIALATLWIVPIRGSKRPLAVDQEPAARGKEILDSE